MWNLYCRTKQTLQVNLIEQEAFTHSTDHDFVKLTKIVVVTFICFIADLDGISAVEVVMIVLKEFMAALGAV